MKNTIKFLAVIIILIVLFKTLELDKEVMKIVYRLEYKEIVEKYSEEYNIDKYLTYAIIKAESNFNENAKSSSNAIGLMQIMEATALETAEKMDLEITEEELFNPEINIKIWLKYFSELLKEYNDNYQMAIVAYNAGIGNVDKWIEEGTINLDGSNLENVPFAETNNYLRKIVRDYKIYKQLYN